MNSVIAAKDTLESKSGKPIHVLTVAENISYAQLGTLKKEIQDLLETPNCLLILDFVHLEILYSMLVGSLRTLHRDAQAKGGNLVIARAQPHVSQVIQNLGLSQILRIYPDLVAACEALDQ